MAIGDPKTATAMKKELAALKKKRDAGNITAFQFRKQSNAIKKKYGGKPTPSNVSKIFTYISTKTPMDALRDSGALTPSPNSAKAKAAAKAAKTKTQKQRSDRQLIAKAKKKDSFKGLDLRKDPPKTSTNSTSKKSSGKKLSKFEQAFVDARRAGKKTFKFTNRAGKTSTYTTERADKKPLPKKGKK